MTIYTTPNKHNGHQHESDNHTRYHATHTSPSHLGKRSYSTTSHTRSTLQYDRQSLPIYTAKRELMRHIGKHDNIIIVGETGSGKTTQLPQYIYEHYNHGALQLTGMIGVTQPRRIAATTVAKRVAEEIGCQLGDLVGYSIRFDDKCSSSTRIKYMTDGMLLRELQSDPTLSRYSVIVLDEIHGRSVSTDILCALLKQVQEKRSRSQTKLKIICMSATVQAKDFSVFFNNAPVLYVQGRQYNVDVLFSAEPCLDYVDAAVTTALQVHLTMPAGDMLVFMSGSDEIEAVRLTLNDRAKLLPHSATKYIITPIYSTLSADAQAEVFQPTPVNTRKIIVATNIAETSVTIPNIVYVIDTGLVKQRHYSSETGVDRLNVVPVSQAEAFQRSGRAGRVRDGQCYRLMCEDDFLKLRANIQPEIERTDLATVILQLLCLDTKPDELELLTKPSKHTYLAAYKQLLILDAIDAGQQVTPLGRQITQFPLSPQYSKMLILSCSDKFGCSAEMLSLVAMMSTDTIYTSNTRHTDIDRHSTTNKSRRQFSSIQGDHITYLQLYNTYTAVSESKRKQWCVEHGVQHRSLHKADQIREQLQDICQRLSLSIITCNGEYDRVRRCLLTGLCQHTARLQDDGSYQTLTGKPTACYIHPSSVLIDSKPRPDTVIYTELLQTSKLFIRDITVINPMWLTELLPKLYAGTNGAASV